MAMFGKREGGTGAVGDKVETIIGQETTIQGSIHSSGVLRIDGKVEGDIHHRGDLIIGETGEVTAKVIEARHVSIAGTVRSSVVTEGKLELVPSGRLYGDIKVAGLIIGEGAIFRGNSEMKSPDEKVQTVAASGRQR